MFIRKKTKYSLYIKFLTLVLLILGAGLLYFKNAAYKSPYSVPSYSLFNILPLGNAGPACIFSDSIEYVYYKDTPDNFRNNKFGLYIYAEEERFIKLADQLVNSNGGDWGYVLIPYNINDRDKAKWGRVFTQLHTKHLIPVIQLWDVDPENYEEQTLEAAEFLDSFVWPIKHRYISVYNEPNDSKFWKDLLDPKNYAEVLDFTIATFKEQNPDFFMLNGAFNVSAATGETYMDSFYFMRSMNAHIPGIFNKLDGWASHSYPQTHFSGDPLARGRWSIRAYEEELELLKSLGVEKELPVFITETGWAHAEGKNYDSSYLSVQQIADNFRIAYEEVWLKDSKVRAVMPFTVRFEPPYDHFSWVDHRNVPYAHFQEVKSMKKVSGEPPYLESSKVSSVGCQIPQ